MSVSSYNKTSERLLSCPTIEAQYVQALVCLEQAQNKRIEAVSHFLEIQAQWKHIAASEFSYGEESRCALEHGEADTLDQAEAALHRAKSLYCNALEQQCLIKQLVNHLRIAFHQAQENLERLALEHQEERVL